LLVVGQEQVLEELVAVEVQVVTVLQVSDQVL
jgi:hypothetical protein